MRRRSPLRPIPIRQAIINILLFLGALLAAGVSTVSGQAVAPAGHSTAPPTELGLQPRGNTFNRAQAATWLDHRRFAVGRWDGTITVFRTAEGEAEIGPVLVEALAAPARRGIEMLTRLTADRFVSSNDRQSLALWQPGRNGSAATPLPYSGEYGIAVSGLVTAHQGLRYLLVGHQYGDLSIWSLAGEAGSDAGAAGDAAPRLLRVVSLRSAAPVRWQWQTWHIRGLANCGGGRVVSAAEDGDLCVIQVPSGEVLSRRRYHATAQRGLNDVAVCGDLVAAVNCAVGADDRNLWVFRLIGDSLQPVDSTKLVADPALDPVFAFSVELFPATGVPHFVASTEEGLVWLGLVKDHKITVLGKRRVAVEGGDLLAVHPNPLTVLAAGHKIQTFSVDRRPIRRSETGH